MSDLVERLRSNELLPVCPYDRRSPDYWTAPNDKPCVVCGGLNDPDAPDLCRGADTRVMKEAADEIERLRTQLASARKALETAQFVLSDGAFTGPLVDDALNKIAITLHETKPLTDEKGT